MNRYVIKTCGNEVDEYGEWCDETENFDCNMRLYKDITLTIYKINNEDDYSFGNTDKLEVLYEFSEYEIYQELAILTDKYISSNKYTSKEIFPIEFLEHSIVIELEEEFDVSKLKIIYFLYYSGFTKVSSSVVDNTIIYDNKEIELNFNRFYGTDEEPNGAYRFRKKVSEIRNHEEIKLPKDLYTLKNDKVVSITDTKGKTTFTNK